MQEILSWFIVSIVLLVVFGITFLSGIFRKRKKTVITSMCILVLVMVSGSWTIYLFVTRSYTAVSNTFDKASEVLAPRTGEEIYTALFDTTGYNCLKILNYQDQNIPVLDYAIWLHFETCPDELNRILLQHDYTAERKSTKGWNNTGPLADQDWYKPESLGDTVLVFTYKKDEFGNYQEIFVSPDTAEAYCKDVFD